MGMTFRKLKKLWLVYLFLLFFSFFMFALSINVYINSLPSTDLRKRTDTHRKGREKGSKNVIVAHYIGTGNIFGNMTKEEINQNNFAPIRSEGENGKPVVIPARDSLRMQRLFQVNSFNILASDRIPLNRSLPDYRKNECRKKEYPTDLPSTSIIIVFHNEAWSVLMRTIWSVINRSPHDLIKEIILVDDASERSIYFAFRVHFCSMIFLGYLKKDLEDYVSKLPVITRIYRMPQRQGLVPARLLGAREASGDVLTFLDAHCECSKGWLEPLLFRIKENPKSVVCPVIDIISDDNFSYTKTFEFNSGAFNWQLQFRWFVLHSTQIQRRTEDVTQPFYTPGMAGGLFSINKDYFFEMGSYDENMKIWGGENVEMSFRIWQCGGMIEISPCSHVGHLFRKTSPYTFPGGVQEVLSSNLARVAMVWMDKWADFFFMYNPINNSLQHSLNVSERLQLRERLNCKSFEWYLKEIWPNNFFPAPDRFFGKIINLNQKTKLAEIYERITVAIPSRMHSFSWDSIFKYVKRYTNDLLNALDLEKDSCLRKVPDNLMYSISLSSATVGDCVPDQKLQDMFVITPNGQIMTNEGVCLDAYADAEKDQKSSMVRLTECTETTRQLWTYDMAEQKIRHNPSNLCLSANIIAKNNVTVQITECGNDYSQKWALVPLQWTT